MSNIFQTIRRLLTKRNRNSTFDKRHHAMKNLLFLGEAYTDDGTYAAFVEFDGKDVVFFDCKSCLPVLKITAKELQELNEEFMEHILSE